MTFFHMFKFPVLRVFASSLDWEWLGFGHSIEIRAIFMIVIL